MTQARGWGPHQTSRSGCACGSEPPTRTQGLLRLPETSSATWQPVSQRSCGCEQGRQKPRRHDRRHQAGATVQKPNSRVAPACWTAREAALKSAKPLRPERTRTTSWRRPTERGRRQTGEMTAGTAPIDAAAPPNQCVTAAARCRRMRAKRAAMLWCAEAP